MIRNLVDVASCPTTKFAVGPGSWSEFEMHTIQASMFI